MRRVLTDMNIDTLQMKLMHLDEVARRNDHDDRELFASALERFLCHKQHPKIGFLISSILSTPAESKILKKEQKFLKLHGNENNVEKKESAVASEVVDGPKPDNFAALLQMMQPLIMQNQMPRAPFQPFPATPTPRQFRPRTRTPYSGCFICGDLSHVRAFCPRK